MMLLRQKDCKKCGGSGSVVDMKFLDGRPTPVKVVERCVCVPRVCIFCDGEGWQYVDADGKPVPQDLAIGQALPVRRCDCKALDDVKNRIEGAKIPKKYHMKINLDVNSGNSQAVNFVRRNYAKIADGNFGDISVVLYGQKGTGKTTIISQFIKAIIENKSLKTTVLWVDFRELMAGLKSEIGLKEEEKTTRLDEILAVDLLVVDDLYAGRGSEFDTDVIDRIISYRYNHNLPIFITTNLTASEMFGPNCVLGSRSASRLQEICEIIEVKGDDFRDKNIVQFNQNKRR